MTCPRRAALYLPASNPRAIAKARTLIADVMILDLEDAVAPEAKADARAAAVAAIDEGGFGMRELVVRANGLGTGWGADDLAALAAAKPDAILVPKVSDAADVAIYVERAGGVPVWAMVETAGAVLRLDAIAAVPGLAALVMGTNDLAKDLRMRPGADRLPMHGFLAATVAAARAHGRIALDGVWNAIDDAAGLAAECAQAVAFGFDGKTLIHPGQIDACLAAFRPSAAEIAAAEAIVAAFAQPGAAGKGAIRHAGGMVERLHLAEAEALLARAKE
ncbi:CoA ester lyase [Sphingomonas bacterium]|uniref:HpcH/HpaI aldolase/citrate lyase family protein n=1 Tax=Sphingomonas bacterium TaxID=1895847 RepID=UPI001576A02A|nr:CoA ester lyase [Sphingomonas bacterium]